MDDIGRPTRHFAALAALRGRLAHHVGERNTVQKTMYIGVLGVIILVVLSGLSIWTPVQFQELTALSGGTRSQSAAAHAADHVMSSPPKLSSAA